QFIVGAVFDETGDKALRSHVLWHVLSSLSRISDRLCQIPDGQKSAVANSFIFMLSFLRTPLERLDANTDEGMAKWMGDGLSQLIATQLAAGVLSVTLIHDALNLSLPTFTPSQRFKRTSFAHWPMLHGQSQQRDGLQPNRINGKSTVLSSARSVLRFPRTREAGLWRSCVKSGSTSILRCAVSVRP